MDTENKTMETRSEDTVSLPPYLKNIFDFVEMFAVAACIVLLVFTFLTRMIVVDGDSMNTTLINGERILITDLFYTPKQGDIVVVHSPDVLDGKAIVKRVIATEGQLVEIKRDGVYVYNPDGSGGKLQETDGSLGYTVVTVEEREAPDGSVIRLPYSYSPQTVLVGEGEVFVMGDNRPDSYDSEEFGCVSERAIVGKAYVRLFPLSKIGAIR